MATDSALHYGGFSAGHTAAGSKAHVTANHLTGLVVDLVNQANHQTVLSYHGLAEASRLEDDTLSLEADFTWHGAAARLTVQLHDGGPDGPGDTVHISVSQGGSEVFSDNGVGPFTATTGVWVTVLFYP